MKNRGCVTEEVKILRAEIKRLKGELYEEKRQHLQDLDSVMRMVLLIGRKE